PPKVAPGRKAAVVRPRASRQRRQPPLRSRPPPLKLPPRVPLLPTPVATPRLPRARPVRARTREPQPAPRASGRGALSASSLPLSRHVHLSTPPARAGGVSTKRGSIEWLRPLSPRKTYRNSAAARVPE